MTELERMKKMEELDKIHREISTNAAIFVKLKENGGNTEETYKILVELVKKKDRLFNNLFD